MFDEVYYQEECGLDQNVVYCVEDGVGQILCGVEGYFKDYVVDVVYQCK